jgi:hypothetical protein
VELAQLVELRKLWVARDCRSNVWMQEDLINIAASNRVLAFGTLTSLPSAYQNLTHLEHL